MPQGPTSGDYWNGRYHNEGAIWGMEPSPTVEWAHRHFQAAGCRSLLVAGCGYGRNLAGFATRGYPDLTGVDVSGEAVRQARLLVPGVPVLQEDLLGLAPDRPPFDALYAFNLLHFFLEGGRRTFAAAAHRLVRHEGLLALSVFSTREKACGTGSEVEPGTWETKPGRPAHYFRHGEIAQLFQGFQVIEELDHPEPETHGPEGLHTHHLLLALLRRHSAS